MLNEKMCFGEFQELVLDIINEYLPEKFFGATIRVDDVIKNNGCLLHGLVIKPSGQNLVPTLYLESYYALYLDDIDIDDIMKKIINDRIKYNIAKEVNPDDFISFEKWKNQIIPTLINANLNRAQLYNRPHTLIVDLAITYCIQFATFDDGVSTISITNSIFQTWDISLAQLHEIALKNMMRLQKSTLQSIHDVLCKLIGMSENVFTESLPAPDMYILRNSIINGATALLDIPFMNSIYEQLGNFYILPSSIHEVIVIPSVDEIMPIDLIEMVYEANETQVSDNAILSNHVYIYRPETGLKIAQ